MTFEFVELHGLELIRSCAGPFCWTLLPWPTKGWPYEIMGLRPFARPYCLLVNPGDICPPHKRGGPTFLLQWEGLMALDPVGGGCRHNGRVGEGPRRVHGRGP